MKPRHRELPVAVKPGDPPKPFPRSLGKGLPCFVVLSAGISCFGVHAQTEAGMKYHPEGSATMLTAAVFQLNQEFVKSADTQHLGFWTQTGETSPEVPVCVIRAHLGATRITYLKSHQLLSMIWR